MERKKILVCEDQIKVSEIMASHFREQGFEVDVANRFSEVKYKLAFNRYDVVVCDTCYRECEPLGNTVFAYKKSQFLDYTPDFKPVNHDTLFIINEDHEEIGSNLGVFDLHRVMYSPCEFSALISPKERRTFSDETLLFLEQSRVAENKIKAVELALHKVIQLRMR